MKTVVAILNFCLLILPVTLRGGETDGLGKSFDTAIRSTRLLMQRQKIDGILLLVQLDKDSIDNPAGDLELPALEQLLRRTLSAPAVSIQSLKLQDQQAPVEFIR